MPPARIRCPPGSTGVHRSQERRTGSGRARVGGMTGRPLLLRRSPCPSPTHPPPGRHRRAPGRPRWPLLPPAAPGARGPAAAAAGAAGGVITPLSAVPVGSAVVAKDASGKHRRRLPPTAGTGGRFSAICTHMGCTVAPAGRDASLPLPRLGMYDAATGRGAERARRRSHWRRSTVHVDGATSSRGEAARGHGRTAAPVTRTCWGIRSEVGWPARRRRSPAGAGRAGRRPRAPRRRSPSRRGPGRSTAPGRGRGPVPGSVPGGCRW